jgi:hypothetical protein
VSGQSTTPIDVAIAAFRAGSRRVACDTDRVALEYHLAARTG